ncbi:MAG: DUF3341 domain-containing protein [Planctomycetes bacterium]|nr:DUF3341 domain-containing protein [Planctomycetota bacterium]
MAEGRNLAGVVGLCDDVESLLRAASAVRAAGYREWDCHTPYPVHGLDRAMGLKASPIPAICLAAGFAGAGVALLMQWWMSAVDYPVRIGGKPLYSWPAFVPIVFELFVLFSALATVCCVLVLCRLGRWHSPLHDSDVMRLVTSDRFAVVLRQEDRLFAEQEAAALLARSGCREVRPLYEREEDGSLI